MERGSLSALLLVCGAAACSSSSGTSGPSANLAPGGATIDSTFTFAPSHLSASAALVRDASGHATLVVTSLRGAPSCSLADMGQGTGVADVMRVAVTLAASGSMQPGMYPLGSGWQANYRMADVLCATSGEATASNGNLEIDSAGSSLRGIVDVTFPTGRVIATFDAPVCDAPTGSPVGAQTCAHLPSCPVPQGADLNPTPTTACNSIF